jgi:hypothetical protein
MPSQRKRAKRRGLRAAPGCLVALAAALAPAPVGAQWAAREALESFPADTQQITYANLAQLRALPEYPNIQRRILGRKLIDFHHFLRSAGADPDRDVDEVVLGWRGEGTEAMVGVASGRFDAAGMRDFFARYRLPLLQHAGQEIFVFGSGEERDDFQFCFLDGATAAFGRGRDLRALLDVRAGLAPALDSNPVFVNGEAELQGTAPQWGIASGKAALNYAAAWLAAGRGDDAPALDPGVLLGPLRVVLYRVEWGSGITTHVSVECQSVEKAEALAQLLAVWRQAAGPPALEGFLRDLEVHTAGARLELVARGPLSSLDSLLRPGGRAGL